MARINPRQIQYIKEVQPDFDFQERKIQPSLNVATSDDLFRVDNSDVDDNDSVKSKNSRSSHLSRSLSIGGAPPLTSVPIHGRSTIQKPSSDESSSSTTSSAHPHAHPPHSTSPSHRLSSAVGVGTIHSPAGPRLTLAVSTQNHHQPNPNIVPSTPGGGGGLGLSNEDRRLLTRAKWLLKRLLDSDEDPLLALHPFDPDAAILGLTSQSNNTSHHHDNDNNMTTTSTTTSTSLDSELRWKLENKRKKAEKKFYFLENILKDILNDEVKKRETLFVLNILSFLKDGNSKCLSEDDSRSWAQELLQSVGRNTSLISTIMGTSSNMNKGLSGGGGGGSSGVSDSRKSSLTTIDPEMDMDTWRSVLVHMRANYPIGLAGQSAHVTTYVDQTDPLQVKLFKRIETMKADLIDIIHIKEEKIHNSKSGKILESTLSLKEMTGKGTGGESQGDDSPPPGGGSGGGGGGGERSKELSTSSINLYAENILNNQSGKFNVNGRRRRGGGAILEEKEEDADEEEEGEGADDDDDLKKYDDIILTRDPLSTQQQSQILSLQQSLIDTLSSTSGGGGGAGGGGKSTGVEYDDNFIVNKAKKEEEDRERDRVKLRERRKNQQQQQQQQPEQKQQEEK
jgi:hypothetical protein